MKITFEKLIMDAPQCILDMLESLKTFKERDDFHPEPSCWHHVQIVTERLIKTNNINLILSGVLHDIFKKETAVINPKNGFWTCPKHDVLAANFVRTNKDVQTFITNFGGNVETVAIICEQHMRIKQYEEMSEKKRLKFQAMPEYNEIVTFSKADDMLNEFLYENVN